MHQGRNPFPTRRGVQRVRAIWVVPLLAALASGCLAPVPEEPQAPPMPSVQPQIAQATSASFAGTLTAVPVAAAAEDHSFDVPLGATSVVAILRWGSAASELALELRNPEGEMVGTVVELGSAALHARTVGSVAPGAWSVRVRADRAVQEEYGVDVRVGIGAAATNLAEGAFLVQPRIFAELNFEMAAGQGFAFTWSVDEGSDVYFNVHTHRDGEVTNYFEGEYAELEGNWTATDDGGASLLWENVQPVPVTVRYRVEGDFDIHSVFGPSVFG